MTATVDGSGNAVITVPDSIINNAIQKGKEDSKKDGTAQNGISVQLNVSTGDTDTGSVTVNLPKATQEKLIAEKVDSFAVVVDSPDITIMLNLNTITEINRQANANVQLTATQLTNISSLSAAARTALGNRPVYDLKATYANGTRNITSFGSGSVSIEIPYTLRNDETAGGVYAVYVDVNGNVSYLTNSSHDPWNVCHRSGQTGRHRYKQLQNRQVCRYQSRRLLCLLCELGGRKRHCKRYNRHYI